MKKITQLAVLAAIAGATGLQAANQAILNVSYDPTRELYSDINKAFAKQWAAKTGDSIAIDQSHGGSGKQSRSIVDGLEADVATLALAYDIDAISDQAGLLPKNWQARLPDNSSPYTSTIVFVVRKGNPKGVKDWDDLTRDGVKVITPNPKTSGGARWNYLAAYAYALRQNGGDEQKAREFVSKLYSNVPVLDTGARGSTITFTERRMGDVFLSWENEAHLIQKQYPGQYEIITPSLSILAEPPVALVDKVVDRKGTREVAQAYLEFLYTPEAQDIIGRHYYRPRDAAAAAKYSAKFPKIELVTIEDFGGWRKAQKDHFNDGGIFDRIYKPYRP
jgi:sulfate/thiosulfate transport system substrate-binding protein